MNYDLRVFLRRISRNFSMKRKNYTRDLHKRIKQARIKSGITQMEICRKLKISRSALARIEAGFRSPTIHQLEQISEITGINFEHLVLGHEPLQQALDQIDHIQAIHNVLSQHATNALNTQIKEMRDSYIDRYGFPDQDYPVKK